MEYVVDTSIVIAVLVNEEHKARLVEITRGANLNAPSSLHWEVGNAFSAMFKRGRLVLNQAVDAVNSYDKIPIRFHDVPLVSSLELSNKFELYAYDAYFIDCALRLNAPLITLDEMLMNAANKAGVDVVEV